MTIDDRFVAAAASLVVAQQDNARLMHENGLLFARGQKVDEAREIIVLLLKASELGPGLDPHLDERAQEWLKGV